MLEYPEMRSLKQSPRDYCIAFDKLDGSNIRVKFNKKQGFHLFGSRTRLFDSSDNQFGEAISLFNNIIREKLELLYSDKQFKDVREIITFFEFFGENSFAGYHQKDDPKKLIPIDILLVYKKSMYNFILPQEFVKLLDNVLEIPRVRYSGKLNDELIKNVRNNIYNVKEGVVCKGIGHRGDYFGKVWMTKIKTIEYLNKVLKNYGQKGLSLYGE